MLSSINARTLRAPGYSLMTMLLLTPIVEVVIRAAPFRAHSAAWRLELIGRVADGIGIMMLALFVSYAIAIAVEDHPVAYAVAAVSGLGAVLCVVVAGVFSLDAIQVKALTQSPLARGYEGGSVWVVVRLTAAAIILVTIAVTALRSAKNIRREGLNRPAGQRASVLVTTPRSSSAPVTSTPPSGKRREI